MSREFAPLKDRLQSVSARLKQIPAVLEAAKTNLKDPPRIYTETSILQNKGNISLIRDELSRLLDQVPELKASFDPVQKETIGCSGSLWQLAGKGLTATIRWRFSAG